MSHLQIANIDKTFDNKTVLENIDIDIAEGELISVLGPSGCGKTTLLKIIAGLEFADTGKIYFDGEDYSSVSSNNRNAVFVFQDYRLFPHMTVLQNIEFGLKVRGEGKAARRKKAQEMLELIQLSDKGGSYDHELSGGQRQRVALARACVVKPRVLLLDEPFSNLDTNLKEIMREFVSDFQKRLGITAILVTHDKEEAFMMSNRVAVIIGGRLQQFDTPQRIYTSPKTEQLSCFIGEANHIEGTAASGVFTCPLGDFEIGAGYSGEASLMLRFNQIRLSREKTDIPCRIDGKKYAGKTTLYKVTAKDSTALAFTDEDGSFSIGERAYLNIDLSSHHIFPSDKT